VECGSGEGAEASTSCFAICSATASATLPPNEWPHTRLQEQSARMEKTHNHYQWRIAAHFQAGARIQTLLLENWNTAYTKKLPGWWHPDRICKNGEPPKKTNKKSRKVGVTFQPSSAQTPALLCMLRFSAHVRSFCHAWYHLTYSGENICCTS
jgi:hypothetical protein